MTTTITSHTVRFRHGQKVRLALGHRYTVVEVAGSTASVVPYKWWHRFKTPRAPRVDI